MKNNIKKTILPLIVGLLIFLATLHFIGFEKIIQSLLELNMFLYLLAVGCIIASITFWALRWKVFIKANGYDVSLFNLLKILIVGLAFNNLTPLAKFGGEPIRAYLLKAKSGMKMGDGFATVLAELTIFFIVTTGLVVISIFLITILMSPPTWLLIVLVGFGITATIMFLGILGVYSGKGVIRRIIKWLGNKIERLEPYQKKALRRYKEFQETFHYCLKNKKIFTKALSYTIISKIFDFTKFILLFLALGYEVNPVKIIMAMGIAAVILSLPSTPGSLGVYEGGFASALVLLNIPAGIAGGVIFLDRLVWFWIITLIGGSLGTYYGVNFLESESKEKIKEGIENQ